MSPNLPVGSSRSAQAPLIQSARARWTVRIIGITAAVGTAVTVWLGLWVTPPDVSQGDLVRLVYIHPGVAWVALYLAFGLAAVASLLYLWPRTRSLFWDRLAAAAVEVGVVFNVCTLISGSIWGKPTWGVWWAWDARLTSTAVLLVLFLGYLALRRVPAEPDVRAKRSAFVALFAAVDVPIVHFSVLWWKTLHQGATVLNPDLSPTIHGSMAWTLLLGFVSLTLVFVWMLLVRYRIGVLEDWLGSSELDVALVERQAEATPVDRSRSWVDPHDGQPGADGRPDDGVGVGRPVVPEGAR
jgi:heme exporter protein C